VSRFAPRAAVAAACVLAVTPAEAHLMNTGFGPFYDGLAHPLVTPEDLLPVAALALLAGQGGPRAGRWVLFGLPAAWLVGMMVGRTVPVPTGALWLSSSLTIALGALVAADRKLPLPVVAGCAVVLGILHGSWNGSSPAQTSSGPTGPLGVAVTIFVLVALLAGAVVSLRRPWSRIVVRVAGSWIAAIGLLMLGWAVRGAGG
jgi:hydrogenase/urease accessory protein HupE